jgi:hypothetical protein
MYFFICQIVLALFAYCDAREEVYWSYPYRKVKWDGKEMHSRGAHHWGAFGFGILLIWPAVLSLVEFKPTATFTILKWLQSAGMVLFYTVACGLAYWSVFDPTYAKRIGKDWWYLGSSADTDNWLVRQLGPNAGKVKLIVSVLIVALMNILYACYCL